MVWTSICHVQLRNLQKQCYNINLCYFIHVELIQVYTSKSCPFSIKKLIKRRKKNLYYLITAVSPFRECDRFRSPWDEEKFVILNETTDRIILKKRGSLCVTIINMTGSVKWKCHEIAINSKYVLFSICKSIYILTRYTKYKSVAKPRTYLWPYSGASKGKCKCKVIPVL
jgi:hypothetical protein